MKETLDSILLSIKKLLGPDGEDTHFDPDIIMHINTALTDLTQLGVGPSSGFSIADKTSKWTDFVQPELQGRVETIKSYVYLRVKLLFEADSLGAATIAAYEREISRHEVRINNVVEDALYESKST